VLGISSGPIRSHLTVEEAKQDIFNRRQCRIPNDVILVVECQETETGLRFSISPEQVVQHIRSTYDVALNLIPGGCESTSSRWFYECETAETANMLYHVPPTELVSNRGGGRSGRTTDILIFLAPNADDALYDTTPRQQRSPGGDASGVGTGSSSNLILTL
jgi:hypothetical protein